MEYFVSLHHSLAALGLANRILFFRNRKPLKYDPRSHLLFFLGLGIESLSVQAVVRDKKAGNAYSAAGDDDINDVAAMGGVNLAEEANRILGATDNVGTVVRSCKDETFLQTGLLHQRITRICKEKVSCPSYLK